VYICIHKTLVQGSLVVTHTDTQTNTHTGRIYIHTRTHRERNTQTDRQTHNHTHTHKTQTQTQTQAQTQTYTDIHTGAPPSTGGASWATALMVSIVHSTTNSGVARKMAGGETGSGMTSFGASPCRSRKRPQRRAADFFLFFEGSDHRGDVCKLCTRFKKRISSIYNKK